MTQASGGIVKAILGPTNTGKTHYAIERMLSYRSGVMGFPLRLLAREVYDRVVAVKGAASVALITGEERIQPERARYTLCTVEAMPRHAAVDFVAVDEIQMAADRERGHIFTEHLLATRGLHETLFLGADTIRPLMSRLLPEAEIIARSRYSTLSYVKPCRLSRLPRRSAVVAFSATEVYALAELMRREKGGAAIVMGALSPRTRNAQVELYQSGDVDYLVATDAIGMGLNMDIDHLAFAALEKYDGRMMRSLAAAETGQIAGRAGRYKKDGTFSTLSGGEALDPLTVAQVEEHSYPPLKSLLWRASKLDFNSIRRLIRSLEVRTDIEGLSRQRDAHDLLMLKALAEDDDITVSATTPERIRQLWDVCQIPDFRKLAMGDHRALVKRIYTDLVSDSGVIDETVIASAVKRVDNILGDIDTLAGRIASIRVWTYVAHRSGWLADARHWAELTRGVEDRLSDALHERLTQRFVDRRTAVLLRSLHKKGDLGVIVDKISGRVTVEGHEIGALTGFSFTPDTAATSAEQKTLNAAAEAALRTEITRQAKLFANVGFKTLALDITAGIRSPRLLWNGHAVARLVSAGTPYRLRAELVEPHLLGPEEAELVRGKAQDWIDDRLREKLEPLLKLEAELAGSTKPAEGEAALAGMARGIAFQILENYGTLERAAVQAELKQLEQDARKSLRRFGLRFGFTSLYIPFILKPHATELRLILWALNNTATEALPAIPTPGMVWVDIDPAAPEIFYRLAGFKPAGGKAVRMDMIERLADAVRPLGQAGSWFEVTPEIMGLVGLSGEDFAAVMAALGYRHELRSDPLPAAEPAPQEAEAAPPAAGEEAGTLYPETVSEAKPPPLPERETSASVEPATEAGDATEAQAETTAQAKTTAETEGAAQAEGAARAEAETAAESSAETQAEVPPAVSRYVFRWQPARRRNTATQSRRGPRDAPPSREPGRRRKGEDGKADRADRADSGRGKSGKPTAAKERPRHGKQARPKPHKERPIDPDSPFAALAGLKESLEKKS